MARLMPFRALRPVAAVAADVSSPPYDVLSTDEAAAIAEGNPLSFLRVTRSELELERGADPYAPAVYARAKANLERLRREAPLETDERPVLYVYRLKMGDHEQIGVAGCFSVDEYESGVIRRHEKTRPDKENDRTRHIVETRAQTGVVFLTYRASAAVDAIVARVTAGAPLYDFRAGDAVTHKLWRVDGADSDALVAAFAAVPALYIADGHHRAASAARARAQLGAGAADGFLAVAFPHDRVQVLPYHRVVRDLHGRSADELLHQLGQRFGRVEDAAQPTAAGRFSVYLDGTWHSYALAAPAGPGSPGSPIARLDCQRLQEQVLGPLLGVGDPRADERVDFVGGIRGTAELERRVQAGAAAVAFALFPVSVEELLAVSDAGEIMPPKSTWFEPKLRDGLLVHEI